MIRAFLALFACLVVALPAPAQFGRIRQQQLVPSTHTASPCLGGNCAVASIETMANMQNIDVAGMTQFSAKLSPWPKEYATPGFWPEKMQMTMTCFCNATGKKEPQLKELKDFDTMLLVVDQLGLPVMMGDMGGKNSPYRTNLATGVVIMPNSNGVYSIYAPAFHGTAVQIHTATKEELRKRYGGWSCALVPAAP